MPERLPAYDRAGVEAAVRAALGALGDGPLEVDALAALDAFHIMGRDATHALAALGGVAATDRVLDVGCGLAGPARVLACTYGCQVVGIDRTPAYVRLAELLTDRTGLADRVRVHRGDACALPYAEAQFSLIWMQHVSMNIAAKPGLFEEARRVVRPEGRLALFEVVAGAADEVILPVPWAEEATESHLVGGGELRSTAEAAGWTCRHWRDVSDEAQAWFEARRTGHPARALGLHLLLGSRAAEKVGNVAANLREGRIAVVRGLLSPG